MPKSSLLISAAKGEQRERRDSYLQNGISLHCVVLALYYLGTVQYYNKKMVGFCTKRAAAIHIRE